MLFAASRFLCLILLVFITLPCAGRPPDLQSQLEPLESVMPGASAIPSEQSLQDAIAALEQSTGLNEEQHSSALDLYGKALARLQDIDAYRTAAESYQQAQTSAPEEIAELKKELHEAPAPQEPLPTGGDLKELQSLLDAQQAELEVLQKRLAEYEEQALVQQGRPAAARTELAEARSQLEDVEQALQILPADTADLLADANRKALTVEQAALKAQIAMLERELLTHAVRLELLVVSEELLEREVKQNLSRVEELREAVNAQRYRETAAVIARTERQTRQAADEPDIVREAAERNQEFSEQLAELTVRIDETARARSQFEQQFKELEARFLSVQNQLEIAGLSDALGPLLRNERKQLPNLRQYRRGEAQRREQIEEVRLQQFQVYQQRRGLIAIEEAVDQSISAGLETDIGAEERQAISDQLRKLLDARRALLDQLGAGYTSYVDNLTALDQAQRELIERAQGYAKLLDENLLWIASGNPINPGWFNELRAAAGGLLAPGYWLAVGDTLSQHAAEVPLATVVVVLVCLALLLARPRLRRRLSAMSEHVGKVQKDSFFADATSAADHPCARAAGAFGLDVQRLAAGRQIRQFSVGRLDRKPAGYLGARPDSGSVCQRGGYRVVLSGAVFPVLRFFDPALPP